MNVRRIFSLNSNDTTVKNHHNPPKPETIVSEVVQKHLPFQPVPTATPQKKSGVAITSEISKKLMNTIEIVKKLAIQIFEILRSILYLPFIGIDMILKNAVENDL